MITYETNILLCGHLRVRYPSLWPLRVKDFSLLSLNSQILFSMVTYKSNICFHGHLRVKNLSPWPLTSQISFSMTISSQIFVAMFLKVTMEYNISYLSDHGFPYSTNTLMSLIVGGHISVLAEKNFQKWQFCEINWNILKKTKRDEAIKWYFLHSPGQEEHFKLHFTLLPKVF